jgi:hypothetical protein
MALIDIQSFILFLILSLNESKKLICKDAIWLNASKCHP